MGNLPDVDKAFYLLLVLAALLGWAVIEFILWIFSHISISWGG